jgi:hypothetical protein
MAEKWGKDQAFNFVFATTHDPEYVLSYFMRDLTGKDTKIVRHANGLDIQAKFLSGPAGVIVMLLAMTLILIPVALVFSKVAATKTHLRITASPTQDGSSVIVAGTILSSLVPTLQNAYTTLHMS